VRSLTHKNRARLFVESGRGPFDNVRQKAWLLPD
jgi:hypothetical protein